MEKKEATKIIKILRGSEIAFFVALMAMIFILSPNGYCAYFHANMFGVTFGMVDIVSLLYTAWLMIVSWAERKYQPQKRAGLWEILAIISVGCLVLFKILYTANP